MPQGESPAPCPCESVPVRKKAFARGLLKGGSLDSLSLEDVGAGRRSGYCCFGEMQVGRDSTRH